MKFYLLKNKEMPWDDYGEVLFAGCGGVNRKTKEYSVWRTAPYVPSVCKAGRAGFLFITDTMKRLLEDSGLCGLTFLPAVKEHIVFLDWEKWDLTAPEPKIYPGGDMDAEEYITRRKHNDRLAEEMENIWAAIPIKNGYDLWAEGSFAAFAARKVDGYDIFIPANAESFIKKNIYVSEKGRNWFIQNANGDVSFADTPVPIKEIQEQELIALEEKVEQERIKQEKASVMTDADWRQWHRLTREAEKLSQERHNAKSEAVKIRRTEKAISNLLEADKLYPICPGFEDLFIKLQKVD
jgi:hypothetical protein